MTLGEYSPSWYMTNEVDIVYNTETASEASNEHQWLQQTTTLCDVFSCWGFNRQLGGHPLMETESVGRNRRLIMGLRSTSRLMRIINRYKYQTIVN